MILEMIMAPLFLGMSAWAPPRMIAAILLGPGALPPPATFNLGIFVAALIVHFAPSIVYALILAWIVHRWNLGTALLAGAVFGLVLYLVNFYGFTAIFPWFAMERNWAGVFAHIVFGIVAAWAYKGLEAPAVRPGVSPGKAGAGGHVAM